MDFKECFRVVCQNSIVSTALQRLRAELPKSLRYHVASHTDDVLSEALTFACYDKVSDKDLMLIGIAAAFHDLGFITQMADNEEIGAVFASDAMRAEGSYSDAEISQVYDMIIDTKLQFTEEGPRQIPRSSLAGYLLDADVSNLGRNDFFEKAELVRQEVSFIDKDQFLRGLVAFLEAHRWYTPAALALRQAKKDQNLIELKDRVKRLKS